MSRSRSFHHKNAAAVILAVAMAAGPPGSVTAKDLAISPVPESPASTVHALSASALSRNGGLGLEGTGMAGVIGVSHDVLMDIYEDMAEAASQWDGVQKSILVDISKYHLSKNGMDTLLSSFLDRYPEFFFLNGNGNYYTDGPYVNTMSMDIDTSRAYTLSNVELFNERAAIVLSGAEKDWTDMQKVLYIHDYIVTHVSYDPTLSNFTAYDALILGKSVCQGYALLFQYMMNAMGIESDIVSSAEMAHSWNMVRIDGTLYHVDCTWDDPNGAYTYYCPHENLLKSRDGIAAAGHDGQDWTDPLGNDVYSIAAGSQYDDAFWTDVITNIPSVGKYSFYPSDDGIMRYDTGSGSSVLICDFPALWGEWGSDQYFDDNFTSLDRYGDGIVASAQDSVYAISTSGEKSFISGLSTFQTTLGRIFGIQVDDDTLYYELYQSPTGSKTGSYIIDLAEALHKYTVEEVRLSPGDVQIRQCYGI